MQNYGVIVVNVCQAMCLIIHNKYATPFNCNGDCGSIWRLAAMVVFMWLPLTLAWSLYMSALLACLWEATGWPKSPCTPNGRGRHVRVEVTVNEWVPGAFVLEVTFKREGGAIANGTIPVHVWIYHFYHSAVPFLHWYPGTSHSLHNVIYVLSGVDKYCHVNWTLIVQYTWGSLNMDSKLHRIKSQKTTVFTWSYIWAFYIQKVIRFSYAFVYELFLRESAFM
jgi:hypothetical protein